MLAIDRLSVPAMRGAFALFAVYALVTVPSLLPRWGASPQGLTLALCWLALAAAAWPVARGDLVGGRYWAMLIGAGVAVRIAALPLGLHGVPIGDPANYVALAARLDAGRGLLFHDPVTRADFLALYPPGYPLLLAMPGAAFGLGVPVIWALNIAFDLGTAALIVRLGARIGAPAGGRAAGWLLVTWPTFAMAAPFAQKESAMMLLIAAILLTLLDLARRDRTDWLRAALLGLAVALLALVQPGAALLPGLFALAIVLPARGVRGLVAIGIRAMPFVLLGMAPWWARNYTLLHHFVPLTSTGGIGLWVGNNPEATGNFMPMPQRFWGLPELEQSARAAAEAKAWIAGHPAGFVRLTATKLVRSMGVEQFTVLRLSLLHPPVGPATLAALFPLGQASLFAVLAATAALLGRAHPLAQRLLLAGLAQIALFGVWFEFGERHRYFLMPLVLLALGCAIAAPRRVAPRAAGGPVPVPA